MANRMVTRRFAGRSVRRATEWVPSGIVTARTALAAGSVLLHQTFAFSAPATIVRVRGSLWVGSDQSTATESPFGAIGLAVVTDQAVAIGVTAIPAPIADADSQQFLLWAPFLADVRAGADNTSWNAGTFTHTPMESKAMRKVDKGTAVVVVIENSSATDGMLFVVEFRMLVKVH